MSKNLRVLMISCAILYGINFLYGKYITAPQELEKKLQAIVAQQNKELPKVINPMMRLDSVASEPKFTYHANFTVTNPAVKQISHDQFEKVFRQSDILPTYCNDPNFTTFWIKGGKIKFSLYAEDKSLLYEFMITNTDCKALPKK